MDFGKVSPTELDTIDFTLPPEPADNKKILPGIKNNSAKVYVGCAKWGRPDWVVTLYPPKTKEKDFLKHYVAHYNSIELNLTHYKIFGAMGVRKWAEKVGNRDFKFCPKMYQGITHKGRLNGKVFLSNEFFRGIRGLDQHLGPVFVQVSEKFSPKRKEELFIYLRSLPTDLQFFLEVRHRDWFQKELHRNDLFTFLKEHRIGAVITDTADRRDCVHMQLALPKVFIRFVGNSLHPTDFTRIDDWVGRIKYWLDNGLDELYFFMHMHDEAKSPELTVYLVDQMNRVCGLHLIRPSILPQAH